MVIFFLILSIIFLKNFQPDYKFHRVISAWFLQWYLFIFFLQPIKYLGFNSSHLTSYTSMCEPLLFIVSPWSNFLKFNKQIHQNVKSYLNKMTLYYYKFQIFTYLFFPLKLSHLVIKLALLYPINIILQFLLLISFI